jgi:hypothetical protein
LLEAVLASASSCEALLAAAAKLASSLCGGTKLLASAATRRRLSRERLYAAPSTPLDLDSIQLEQEHVIIPAAMACSETKVEN